jgi:hypothetical protein
MLDTVKGDELHYENNQFKKITDSEEKLKSLKWRLEALQKKVEVRIKDPKTNYQCGRYLFDGSRQYGFSFEQLQSLLRDYQDPKSVRYKHGRGFVSLIQWLYEVGHTSIGDLHGDLPKHVVVTFHRPNDFPKGQEEAIYKKYDDFWDEVRKLFYE